MELLKHHKSEEKLKDAASFTVGLHPDYQDTRCFFVVKKDGTKEDFSFHKCLNSMIGVDE
jgi:DNA-directed RNA polymerase IV subunit 1